MSTKKTVTNSAEPYVRFETMRGVELFHSAGDLRDLAEHRTIHMSRKELRELETLWYWLRTNTPVPPPAIFADTHARPPRTWFKSEAAQHIAHADRLHRLLNRYRANLRPVYSRDPGVILFDDVCQAVVRPHSCDTPPPRPRERTPPADGRQPWSGDRSTFRYPVDWFTPDW